MEEPDVIWLVRFLLLIHILLFAICADKLLKKNRLTHISEIAALVGPELLIFYAVLAPEKKENASAISAIDPAIIVGAFITLLVVTYFEIRVLEELIPESIVSMYRYLVSFIWNLI